MLRLGNRPPGKRRQLLHTLVAATGALLWPLPGRTADAAPIRVGISPAFLNHQHDLVEAWRHYIQTRLDRSVLFVRRDSYRETMDLFRLKQLDFAWICDYPFLHLKTQVRLLAVPIYNGRPYYRSYLIVPGSERHIRSIRQLKNTVFAYADPYSNTGYLVPRYALLQLGEDPATFFRKTFFTLSHRKVVEAVAIRLADGGAVDSYVYDTLTLASPEQTARTRIVEKSPEYGFPPFVAHSSVSDADFNAFQGVMLGMSKDAEGAALLRRLHLDGFTPGALELYDGVRKMMIAFGED
jgi:phosphonate transport system substrate-binding protein